MRILTLFEFTDREPLLNRVAKSNIELIKLDSLSAFERFSLKTDSDIVLLCVESITATHVKFIERLMRFAPLPLIITSKSAELSDIAALLHCGRVTYIPQQFDFERLDKIIQLACIRFTTATQLLNKLTELEQSIDEQKLVNVAKQQLQQSGLSESDAHTALQQQAMSSGRSLASIAANLCHSR
ncbi:ANTAR domain-containing protein [Shewanella abyssi]|uniref:ANTAR domain-containing response regulator n=1 Tax=Shewanella abyssi TaxID=311789 RepID=UPI00200DB2D0|nr:ANTAR domain-containing protein [Shewanella abyssi]MCL1049240.1 ANTAR domain-containing protein [Shewanella abyssi]